MTALIPQEQQQRGSVSYDVYPNCTLRDWANYHWLHPRTQWRCCVPVWPQNSIYCLHTTIYLLTGRVVMTLYKPGAPCPTALKTCRYSLSSGYVTYKNGHSPLWEMTGWIITIHNGYRDVRSFYPGTWPPLQSMGCGYEKYSGLEIGPWIISFSLEWLPSCSDHLFLISTFINPPWLFVYLAPYSFCILLTTPTALLISETLTATLTLLLIKQLSPLCSWWLSIIKLFLLFELQGSYHLH